MLLEKEQQREVNSEVAEKLKHAADEDMEGLDLEDSEEESKSEDSAFKGFT